MRRLIDYIGLLDLKQKELKEIEEKLKRHKMSWISSIGEYFAEEWKTSKGEKENFF